MNIPTLQVCSLVPANKMGHQRWINCKHKNRCREYIHDYYNGYIEWYCCECGVTLDKPEDRPIKPTHRKLAKNERICSVCGRIFRVKRNQRNRKYCCNEHYIIAKNKKTKHRNGLGTNTQVLSDKAIKTLAYNVKNNIDVNLKQYNSATQSAHEIESKFTCYYPSNSENSFDYIGKVRPEKNKLWDDTKMFYR